VLFRRILNTNGDLRFRDVFSNRKAERMVKRCTFQCIKHGLAPCLTRVYSYGINISVSAPMAHRKLACFNILWWTHGEVSRGEEGLAIEIPDQCKNEDSDEKSSSEAKPPSIAKLLQYVREAAAKSKHDGWKLALAACLSSAEYPIMKVAQRIDEELTTYSKEFMMGRAKEKTREVLDAAFAVSEDGSLKLASSIGPSRVSPSLFALLKHVLMNRTNRRAMTRDSMPADRRQRITNRAERYAGIICGLIVRSRTTGHALSPELLQVAVVKHFNPAKTAQAR